MRQATNNKLFEVGDRVLRRQDGAVAEVMWVSKGQCDRRNALISTSLNDRAHPYSDASLFELAQ